MAPRSSSFGAGRRARLGELTRRLMSVSTWMGRYLAVRFEPFGLTAASARALLQLELAAPIRTRELAQRLRCDPSNVTAFVDRLEESGLIERMVDPDDRRVKALAMTADGRRVRHAMDAIIETEVPSFHGLTIDEQRTLLALLDKAWAACREHDLTSAAGRHHRLGAELAGAEYGSI